MGGNDNASGKFEGFRGVINDIRLLLTDLLGLGRPDAEQQVIIERQQERIENLERKLEQIEKKLGQTFQ